MARTHVDGREPTLEDTMSTIARQALQITHLEDENASLRNQLAEYRVARTSVGVSDPSDEQVHPAALGMYSSEQYGAMMKELKDLSSRFDDLQSKHAGCEETMKRYLDKCKEYKDYAKGWKEWKDREMAKKNLADLAPAQRHEILLTKKHHAGFDRPQQGSDDALEPPLTPVSLPEAGVEQGAAFRAKTNFPAFPSSPPPLSHKDAPRPSSGLGVPRVTSSQTTVDDTPAEETTISPHGEDASSDNEPVFVSARSLKRKGGVSGQDERPAQRIKQEPKSQERPIELTSSPQRIPERTVHHQISDLDAVGTRMITPRKPQRISEIRERASSEEATRARPSLNRNASSYSEGDEPVQDALTAEHHPKPDHHKGPLNSVTRRQSHSGNQHLVNAPLRPISVNVPTASRTSGRPSNGKSKLRRTGAKDKIRLLSEDGEESSQAAPDDQAGEADDNRLENLLNEPPPERTPTLARRPQQPVTISRKTRQAPTIASIPTPESVIKRPSPQKLRRSPLKRLRQHQNSPPPLRPEDESLRSKHVINLKLDDFKINPKYMGTTHAFTDTLRGRDARRNLHACTRPDCCGGALQKVIAMGGTELTGKTDAQALEAFLGEDWRDHMGGYSAEKRKEITTQAHVFVLANQHGKHKSAFERRSTPPGFWDTDFPTTQQIEENRKQADEMERRQVEDRWREAMREGGRWLFRDE
ncbi:hypothetical protein M409DRAFT_53381 [Zasmidium cellare ATCC 36951]|uniref:DNA endonuclease activator Ctp1 C-terminal domain-containing protein n=1 Tax=Zasmidium cellare ATCC 36951 TaxID=1080233 RepID=A0A6A6CP80_ZASCE|nr:uncharacterized protein M409DRAFT_53381 [Zasmidium cellare ATCC 36951]KAF2168058.1 hypothetical protein M409DRAFT_53381 [Zasmidium cellare ATCC 36951]